MKQLLPLICMTVLVACQTSEKKEKIPAKKERPNILWLVAEDLGPRFAAYGDSVISTPNIDWIANNGVVFENAFTVSGVCAPSRSSIISGMYPTSIGTQHMRQSPSVIPMPGFPSYNAVPPPEVKAFPELLRKAGYWTSTYSKLDYQFGDPFTIWDEVSHYPSWRNRSEKDKDRPFFIYHTFEITHEVNIWPDSTKTRFFNQFNLDSTKLAPDVWKRPQRPENFRIDSSKIVIPPFLPQTPLTKNHLARLYDNIGRMDRQIGEIMTQLREDGLLENTIIMFMSDHGDCLPRSKRWIYDSGIRVPLMCYFPEKYLPKTMSQPSRDGGLYSFIDLAPTVLELANTEIPDWIHGQSITSELQRQPRTYVYAARDRMDNRYDTRRAVRSGRYKYIRNFTPEKPYSQEITFLNQMPLMRHIKKLDADDELNPNQRYWLHGPKPEEELYDLSTDPHELLNLAEKLDLKPVLTTMRNALSQWQDDFGDYGTLDENEQAQKMWPNLEQPVTATPEWTEENGQLKLLCKTEGATIAFKEHNDDRWHIYDHTIILDTTKIAAVKAVRYGYKESEVLLP